MSIELVMPSNHLILGRPLFLHKAVVGKTAEKLAVFSLSLKGAGIFSFWRGQTNLCLAFKEFFKVLLFCKVGSKELGCSQG